MSTFPFFKFSGDAAAIGEQAGRALSARITRAYQLYEQMFAALIGADLNSAAAASKFRARIEEQTQLFARAIQKYFPDIAVEIESMAKASALQPWQLYALNARTELYRLIAKEKARAAACECTALFFPAPAILGQNWDWHPGLEDLALVAEVEKTNGPRIIMLSEPGIVGKIGLNSDGLGACLNILFAECEVKGVPIHVLARAALESSGIDAAQTAIRDVERGTTSNLLLAEASGRGVNLELKGAEICSAAMADGSLVHTNHYLGDETGASAQIPGSVFRLQRALRLYSEQHGFGIGGMIKVLSDHDRDDFPICRPYAPGLDFMVGTIATIVLELRERRFNIARAPFSSGPTWQQYSFT